MIENSGIPKWYRFKVNFIRFGIIAIFIALLYQLVCIQVFYHEKYSALALGQRLKKEVIPTRRGMIFDRNGLKLAETIRVCSVSAVPKQIKDKKKTAEALSDVLHLNTGEILYLLNKKRILFG